MQDTSKVYSVGAIENREIIQLYDFGMRYRALGPQGHSALENTDLHFHER